MCNKTGRIWWWNYWENGKVVAVVKCLLGIHSAAGIRVLSRHGNQNDQDCKIYKHGRVRKSFRVRISYSVHGEGTITITTSKYVSIGRSTKIVLRFLFVFHLCYCPKQFPVHCDHPKKGDCILSWLNIALPSQFHLGIPQRLEWVSTMYHIVCGAPGHTSQVGCIFLPSLKPFKEWLHATGKKGGPALKVRWSIFGNIEMYHSCVQ